MNPMHNPESYNARGGDRVGLGAVLLLNLFSRLKCGICGPNPIPPAYLKTAAQLIDPGYCIDAPEVMPAGGMSNFMCEPDCMSDEPMWLSEMLAQRISVWNLIDDH